MIARLYDFFFGCWHRKYSFPMTREILRDVWRSKQTYVVCLDCGAEFHYDWTTMRAGREIRRPIEKRDQVTEARRAEDELHVAGPSRQKPLTHNVTTIERKKA